ncbi:MAG: hypothetical protein A3A58_01585 [Candidatus Blackburnbacteria bacterium RIFCSPLOWO2_01_FULL_41_27]|uniref:Uncharacterized protein n=2 Tax=Candidatus Blackburniibacteriota TaxID=1817898 RepID=A0A1G1V5L7_9BACT|nr:MAG: hypothetical protein A3F61_02290 [Candidatus Blackburnbacteria bacterium RIFCSPHIGHO2_12_FULL_41_13b]OGY14339.1 MAG: hypothetical protein A3A58_01585 [Candidatus Blackburnbacteria bacterium RIFCSPLOWO2_01_FULL_41_27]
MKFDISKSLSGNQVFFIARDMDGVVRIRAKSEQELNREIEQFNKVEELEKNSQPKKKSLGLKDLFKNKLQEQVEERKEEIASLPPEEPVVNEPEPKQFLQNDLKSRIEKNKKNNSKKGFWDKLK